MTEMTLKSKMKISNTALFIIIKISHFLLAFLLLSLLLIGCHENTGNKNFSRVSEEQEISQSTGIEESTTTINSEKFSTSHPYLFFYSCFDSCCGCSYYNYLDSGFTKDRIYGRWWCSRRDSGSFF